MRAAVAALILTALPAVPAMAQQQPAAATPAPAPAAAAAVDAPASAGPAGFDPLIVDACLSIRSGAPARQGCIGIAASRCLDAAGPVTEAGTIAACYDAETALWQARGAEALAGLADAAAASDSAEGAGPGSGRRAALDVADAAWKSWAEAECALARRMAAGGGAEAAAEAACRLRLTAERALSLDSGAAGLEGP